jgi:hypothetical protein
MTDFTDLLIDGLKTNDDGKLARLIADYRNQVHEPLGLDQFVKLPPQRRDGANAPGRYQTQPDNLVNMEVHYFKAQHLTVQTFGRPEEHRNLHGRKCLLTWTAGRTAAGIGKAKTHVDDVGQLPDLAEHLELAHQLARWTDLRAAGETVADDLSARLARLEEQMNSVVKALQDGVTLNAPRRATTPRR